VLAPPVPVHDPPQNQADAEPGDESEPPLPRHRALTPAEFRTRQFEASGTLAAGAELDASPHSACPEVRREIRPVELQARSDAEWMLSRAARRLLRSLRHGLDQDALVVSKVARARVTSDETCLQPMRPNDRRSRGARPMASRSTQTSTERTGTR
jgi:hypothetical protein